MTDVTQRSRKLTLFQSAVAFVFCVLLAVVISWLAPYYFIICVKTSQGVDCKVTQMLIGCIPSRVHEIINVQTIAYEDRDPGKRVVYYLTLQGRERFDFRADHAQLSGPLIEDLLDANDGEQLFLSDGIIYRGMYISVGVFLFGLLTVLIGSNQRPNGLLAKLPDITEFFIGAYVGLCAAGLVFVTFADIVRAPLWAWGLVVLAVISGGLINVVRMRIKGTGPKDTM